MLRNARDLLGVGVTTARDLGARALPGRGRAGRDRGGPGPGPAAGGGGAPGHRHRRALLVHGRRGRQRGRPAAHRPHPPQARRRPDQGHGHRRVHDQRVRRPGTRSSPPGSWPWSWPRPAGSTSAVAAHAHGMEGIRRAVEAGVTTIEHCSFVTETNERCFSEPLAAQIAERGIFVCPTINVNAPYVAELTGIMVGENVKADARHGRADHRRHRRGHRQHPAPPVRRRAGRPGRAAGLHARAGDRHGHHRGRGGARAWARSPAGWPRATRRT